MANRKTVLTIDDQLVAFLELWESRRVGQIEKHRLAAERYRERPDMMICYEVAQRAQAHAEHELEMLRELHQRAIPPSPSATNG